MSNNKKPISIGLIIISTFVVGIITGGALVKTSPVVNTSEQEMNQCQTDLEEATLCLQDDWEFLEDLNYITTNTDKFCMKNDEIFDRNEYYRTSCVEEGGEWKDITTLNFNVDGLSKKFRGESFVDALTQGKQYWLTEYAAIQELLEAEELYNGLKEKLEEKYE